MSDSEKAVDGSTKRELEADAEAKEDSSAPETIHKKAKIEVMQPNDNEEVVEHLPVIPGFDLPFDTSRVTLPPSTEGTRDYKEADVLR